MSLFSTAAQLDQIQNTLTNYLRLPFSGATIPGSVMEAVLARVRNGQALNTYDFVDVISEKLKCGWQIKSTKASTPVTWKRAKIPTSEKLIHELHKNADALQALGDAIIHFCNDHAKVSIERYGLDEIGFARLILHEDGQITYYERLLCTKKNPKIFQPEDFAWHWSIPKKTTKKEQLSALHGTHIASQKKWWAWHGLGENQLHFSGEKTWWPDQNLDHAAIFRFPAESDKITLDALVGFLSTVK